MTLSDKTERTKEEHKLTLKILEVIEYGSLEDLRTINSYLEKNKFSNTKATAVESLRKDILVMAEKLDEVIQATQNLKWYIDNKDSLK